MNRRSALLAAGACILVAGLSARPRAAVDDALSAAVASPAREPKFVARDAVRHPAEELAFFGLRPDAHVVEIWPGGGYWTEILAPYLAHGKGALTVAVSPSEDGANPVEAFKAKLAGKPGMDAVKITEMDKAQTAIAPPGSADFVLTFRNVHNWMADGYAEQAFAAFFAALKPGGILGVEEHRGRDDAPQDPKAGDGYVRQDYVVALARKAGFEPAGSSEIDANPRDTKDYPKGVWTLPPAFALKDVDRAKYAAIGEADNMVLKFRKPER